VLAVGDRQRDFGIRCQVRSQAPIINQLSIHYFDIATGQKQFHQVVTFLLPPRTGSGLMSQMGKSSSQILTKFSAQCAHK
jgi:hypothetical protein